MSLYGIQSTLYISCAIDLECLMSVVHIDVDLDLSKRFSHVCQAMNSCVSFVRLHYLLNMFLGCLELKQSAGSVNRNCVKLTIVYETEYTMFNVPSDVLAFVDWQHIYNAT